MAQDTNCFQKIISANPIRNGAETVSATTKGTYGRRDRDVEKQPTIEALNNKYKNRFTETRYYST